jgi:hypothetical protein
MDPNMPCPRLKHSNEHGMLLHSTPAPFQHARYKFTDPIVSKHQNEGEEEEEERKDTTVVNTVFKSFSFVLQIKPISHGVVAIFLLAFGDVSIDPAGSHGSDGHGISIR